MKKYIINGEIVLPETTKKAVLVLEDGVISDIVESPDIPYDAEVIDAKGGIVLAGFIDTHVHGGGGYDFMDGTEEAFSGVLRAHMEHGTTSIMPTTVSCPFESLFKVFDIYRKANENKSWSNLLGLNLEGPFISMKSKGAQNPLYIKNPTKEETDTLFEKGADVIARISCAPEIEGADYLAEKCNENGVWLSVAHSDAVCEEVIEAYEKGFNHITHMYCGTTTFRKVEQIVHVGIVEAAYLIDDMEVELIGDGKHIPKELINMVLKIKGDKKFSLVTDAMRAAGTNDEVSYLGEKKPENMVIVEDGVAKLPDRSSYAGSVATMDIVFKNAVVNAGLSLCTASKLVSANPARLSGASRKGIIEKGMDADIVVMNRDYNVECVIVEGEVKYLA